MEELSNKSLLINFIIDSYQGSYHPDTGQYHGQGEIKFKNGNKYIGEFKNGLMDGKGHYYWNDQTQYEGDFLSNSLTGTGSFYFSDGSVYTGQVLDGYRHGEGQLETEKQRYKGQWIKGVREGQGTMEYQKGKNYPFYNGSWFNNKRQGSGLMIYDDHTIYEGDWNNNMKHGKGTIIYQSLSQSYAGQWNNDLFEGEGIYIWHSSSSFPSLPSMPDNLKPICDKPADISHFQGDNRYIGNFVKGKRQGYGIYYYANGSRYEGEWYDNLKNGQGWFLFSNGKIYQGPFIEDRMSPPNDSNTKDGLTPSTEELTSLITTLSEKDKNEENHWNFNLSGYCFQGQILGDAYPAFSLLLSSLNHIILRYNTLLRSIYRFYSWIDSKQREESLTMRLNGLWTLLYHTNIRNPLKGLNLCIIDRYLNLNSLLFRHPNILFSPNHLWSCNIISEQPTPLSSFSPHHPGCVLLYRDFLECLILLSIYEPFEIPGNSIPSCFINFIDLFLKPYARNMINEESINLNQSQSYNEILSIQNQQNEKWIGFSILTDNNEIIDVITSYLPSLSLLFNLKSNGQNNLIFSSLYSYFQSHPHFLSLNIPLDCVVNSFIPILFPLSAGDNINDCFDYELNYTEYLQGWYHILNQLPIYNQEITSSIFFQKIFSPF